MSLQINYIIVLPAPEVATCNEKGKAGPLRTAGCVLQSGNCEKDLGFIMNKLLDTLIFCGASSKIKGEMRPLWWGGNHIVFP